jgi:hypothetical protein
MYELFAVSPPKNMYQTLARLLRDGGSQNNIGSKISLFFCLTCGVEGAEREVPGLQAGDESGAPSSLQ